MYQEDAWLFFSIDSVLDSIDYMPLMSTRGQSTGDVKLKSKLSPRGGSQP